MNYKEGYRLSSINKMDGYIKGTSSSPSTLNSFSDLAVCE